MGTYHANTYHTDRDPEAEAEAEDKADEEKAPGVDEEGPVAIESGFQQGGGDWDAPAPGFAGASTGNWDGAAPAPAAGGDDWAASAAPNTAAGAATTEWATETNKETQW